MNSWEIKRSINKKLSIYRGEEPEKEIDTPSKYSNYEDAKKAGDTVSMIHFKRANKGAGLRALSAEYTKLPILEIQSRIKSTAEMLEKAEAIVERMSEQEYNRLKNEYSRIGGLVDIRLEGAIAEAMQDYTRNNAEYLEALAEYNSVKTEHTALKNAKDAYIVANQQLIEEERVKAQREELISSGILTELGIKQQEA